MLKALMLEASKIAQIGRRRNAKRTRHPELVSGSYLGSYLRALKN
jgi:hypothetical protein